MLTVILAVALVERHPPSQRAPDDPAELREMEHELRLRLAELHEADRSLNHDESTYDLSAIEEVHSEERKIQSELDGVISARRKGREESRMGRSRNTAETPGEIQFIVQESAHENQNPRQSRRGIIRSLIIAAVVLFIAVFVMILRVTMLPNFRHKKDEDLPGLAERRYV
jgi:hypothetical protein